MSLKGYRLLSIAMAIYALCQIWLDGDKFGYQNFHMFPVFLPQPFLLGRSMK